ncbi:BolA family protein [Legionella bononiensis]|uniref:BolA/IbaG family iron-sulfur metabolism protein n=1 Tax=Legionella bononiensis TaxID=2793102 RepID=A0ABS1W859_9GAMM|nr:BolA/IbaG family iron-sulfur metabolism protein [Legionella bononiensis]MBL7479932.1 BolA/IbaG family iron-sulfur metabolism protein [Legionella bononiensis]MBL7525553.1 BolA/IbaG family iron-sulfur metabolism protein [Legionella bononiensis]MBL7561737.1 BolA/IbaG family iron-sulfur metabolism protein [Legionella bononiensis]
MLSNEEIEQRLKSIDEVLHVEVTGDGYQYQLVIVTDIFLNKTRVARQQWVYAQLNDLITTGRLHALSMKTWTKEEWGKQHG